MLCPPPRGRLDANSSISCSWCGLWLRVESHENYMVTALGSYVKWLLGVFLHIDEELWSWKSKGHKKSREVRTLGNKYLILQLLSPQALSVEWKWTILRDRNMCLDMVPPPWQYLMGIAKSTTSFIQMVIQTRCAVTWCVRWLLSSYTWRGARYQLSARINKLGQHGWQVKA